jgi:putative ABC transport system permease protein
MGWFSGIAILIAALGLLAMATYFMRQRAREIAVRKVFGATNGEVLNRLVFSFLKIVLVAFVIAVPVIWYAMSQWLATFAYRIPLRWTIFAAAGILAAAIAFAAVFRQSWRAANTNPVETLHK